MYKLTSEEKKADGRYFKDLDAMIDEVYIIAEKRGLSWHAFAAKANLSPTTVTKLGERTTKRPQHRTIHHLCMAVGLRLALVADTKE